MSRTPAKRLFFLQIPTNMYNEHKVNLAVPWWFSYLLQSNVHPFHQGLSLGWRHMLKLHIEWKLYILYYVNSITIMTCNYCIRWYRLCGFLLSPSAFVCLQTCLLQAIWRTTLVWCAWFPGGWSWSQRVRGSATACFFPNTWTTSIYFPVWYHRWWSNLGEFQSRKTKQVSLMDCPYSWWWSSIFGNVYILYRRQACRVCRLDMFDGNMYVATTSALIWCIVVEFVFPFQLPSFGSSL